VLQGSCLDLGLEPGNRTITQLVLYLFNNAPELLRRARIASIGYRIQTTFAFTFDSSLLKTGFDDKKTIDKIANDVEAKLSTSDKRAQLIEHFYDDTKGTYRFFVKYEDREQRIEEWDGSHWYRPIDWIVVDCDPENGYLSLRCRKESRASQMVAVISNRFTGKNDSFKQTTIDEWANDFDVDEVHVLESDGFKVLDHDIRMLKIEDAGITNQPTVVLRGSKLNESLDDLKKHHKVDLLAGANLVSFNIKIKFEYEGVTDETTILLKKGRNNFSFTKETNEQVKRFLIKYVTTFLHGE
jgi:hypothetical protein